MQNMFTPVRHKCTSLKYDFIGLQHSYTWTKISLISLGEALAEDAGQALNPTGFKFWT